MEENKINEAQFSEVDSSEKNTKRSRFSDFYVEAVLFLILGLLIGFAVKTEANKRITLGYDDYKMNIFQSGYDINELEKEQTQKRMEEAARMQEEGAAGEASETTQPAAGGSCQ